jgi:hypothetical protein
MNNWMALTGELTSIKKQIEKANQTIEDKKCCKLIQ